MIEGAAMIFPPLEFAVTETEPTKVNSYDSMSCKEMHEMIASTLQSFYDDMKLSKNFLTELTVAGALEQFFVINAQLVKTMDTY